VRVSAKVDYALRAIVELAATETDGLVKSEQLATAQGIPPKFLESILLELRHAGLVSSQRGADGGYRLGRPATEIASSRRLSPTSSHAARNSWPDVTHTI